MGITLGVTVPNRINPDVAETLDVNLSISSLDSFSPQEIAKQVPQIRSLLLFKKLLEEIQSNIANKKNSRNCSINSIPIRTLWPSSGESWKPMLLPCQKLK